MTILSRLFLFTALAGLLLPACGGESPTLGVADMPTLVFIYTDG
jgi:hypothetical protein